MATPLYTVCRSRVPDHVRNERALRQARVAASLPRMAATLLTSSQLDDKPIALPWFSIYGLRYTRKGGGPRVISTRTREVVAH